MRISLFILLGVLFAACSAGSGSGPEPLRVLDEIPEHILGVENLTIYPGDSAPLYSIELVRVQSFGDKGEPYLMEANIVALDDYGRVYILSREDMTMNFLLYVYNSDGTYRTQVGRTGRGPGEFISVLNFHVKAGKIFVHDRMNSRLNVYDSEDYSFERATLFEEWSAMDHVAVRNLRFFTFYSRNDGNHLALFKEDVAASGRTLNHKFLLVDTEGDVLNFEPLEVPSEYYITSNDQRRFTLQLPFLGTSVFALSSEDAVYTAWTEDFLIKKYDAEGRYQSAFYYPVLGPPFDMDSFGGWFGYSQRDIRNALEESNVALPETYPVLGRMIADDENRLWVVVRLEDQEMNEWWVLKESGELLAKFLWPRNQPIYEIKNGYLYSRTSDPENKESQIVKYRIDLTER